MVILAAFFNFGSLAIRLKVVLHSICLVDGVLVPQCRQIIFTQLFKEGLVVEPFVFRVATLELRSDIGSLLWVLLVKIVSCLGFFVMGLNRVRWSIVKGIGSTGGRLAVLRDVYADFALVVLFHYNLTDSFLIY